MSHEVMFFAERMHSSNWLARRIAHCGLSARQILAGLLLCSRGTPGLQQSRYF